MTSDDKQDDASVMLQFFEVLRNGLNWAKKLIFWLILRVFLFMLLYTPWDTPHDFALISARFCTPSFLYWFSIHEMAPFWDFSGPNFSKYCLILLTFWPVSNKKITVFKKSLKILNFGSNGMQLNFIVSVLFGAQFTAGKPKTFLKTKISAKTTSSEIVNNISPRSQKNHRILGKLSLKTFFGPH